MEKQRKLTEVNDILTDCLGRLAGLDVSDEDFHKEVQRAEAVANVAKVIAVNANVVLEAQKFIADKIQPDGPGVVPVMLEPPKAAQLD